VHLLCRIVAENPALVRPYRPHLIEKSLIDKPAFALEQIANVSLQKPTGLGESLLEFIEKAHGDADFGFRIADLRKRGTLGNLKPAT
jgi:hypothetical protein